MSNTRSRMLMVALGVVLGVGLMAGPAGAQTTSGGAKADVGSVASGTAEATNGSTASGDAVATDGSTASGCSTATDSSTASGGCPTTTVAPKATTTTTKPATKPPLARTGSETSGLAITATAALFGGLLLLALGLPAAGRRSTSEA